MCEKIKLIPGQSCFETDETDKFLDLCSNVDEYCIIDSDDESLLRVRIVDSDDEYSLCVKDGVLYCRSGLELYRVPPKMEGVFAVPSGVDALRMHAFFGRRLPKLPSRILFVQSMSWHLRTARIWKACLFRLA